MKKRTIEVLISVAGLFPAGVRAASESVVDPLAELAVELLILLLALGGANAARVAELRNEGDPVLPMTRFDAGVQAVDADRFGWDFGGELGYGPLAVDGRYSRFIDDRLEEDTLLLQSHVVYRMALAESLDVGLGIGGAWQRGEGHGNGVSFTTPVRFWPTEWAGVVLRPSWTQFDDRDVRDIEASLLLRVRYATFQVGYRWLDPGEGAESLSGVRAGVGFRY